jgi:hypothetical protein
LLPLAEVLAEIATRAAASRRTPKRFALQK